MINYLLTNKTKSKLNFFVFIINYFQFLLKLLIKHQIVDYTVSFSKLSKLNDISFLNKRFNLSQSQIKKILQTYNQTIIHSQISVQVQLNYKLILITNYSNNWLFEINDFKFLKQNINRKLSKISDINKLIEFPNLRPTIYFSIIFEWFLIETVLYVYYHYYTMDMEFSVSENSSSYVL